MPDENPFECSADELESYPVTCQTDTRDHQAESTAYSWTFWLFYVAGVIYLLVITIRHMIYVRKDLCGSEKDRENLFKRQLSTKDKNRPPRSLPNITPNYRYLNYSTVLALLLWVLCLTVGVLAFFSQSDYGCAVSIRCIVVFQLCAENASYLTHMLRLKRLYQDSPFQCASGCFRCLFVLICTFTLVICTYSATMIEGYRVPTEGMGGLGLGVPNLCLSGEVDTLAVVTSLALCEQFAVTVALYYSYKYPLSKMIDFYKKRGKRGKRIAKMIKRSGYKMAILTTISMVCSTILLAGTGLLNLAILHIPAVICDATVLVLMTSYYSDRKNYERWCGFCTFLWIDDDDDEDQDDEPYEKEHNESTVDTGEPVRKYGAQMKFAHAPEAKASEDIPENQGMKSVVSDSEAGGDGMGVELQATTK